jgi:hypothetical protein
MLGNSAQTFNSTILQLTRLIAPHRVLELGCGEGKFGTLLQQSGQQPKELRAVQRLFAPGEEELLQGRGYHSVVNRDILDFYREGFDDPYDLIVALDVIEHFLISDVMSIINFSLYRADWMLLVWPSAHPQVATTNAFDRHRASFELRDLTAHFDAAFYAQSGFAQMHFLHRYHIALLRGFMNSKVLPPPF